jgi:hypothetical protein
MEIRPKSLHKGCTQGKSALVTIGAAVAFGRRGHASDILTFGLFRAEKEDQPKGMYDTNHPSASGVR